jgi:DNA polymerase-3 subunit delta
MRGGMKSNRTNSRIPQNPLRDYRIFVIYGPDRGLVSERAGQIAAKLASLSRSVLTDQARYSDLQKDPGRPARRGQSIGLFGGEKLVWIRGAANEKYLVDSLSVLSSKNLRRQPMSSSKRAI